MAVDLEYYGVPPADYRENENRTRITATAGQTTFTAPYSVGYVDVYFNGAKLDPFSEFTGTDGANIVLSAAALAGDIVEIISRGQVQLANIYTQQQTNALVPVFAVATGTGDAQLAITNPSFATYSDGLVIKIRTAGQNATTTPTINCNSIGVKSIVSNNAGAALYGKDWVSGSEITLRYNQTLDKLVLIDGQTTILTPPQFDSSNQYASTGFVQRALGNYQSFIAASTNTTLTTAQSGSLLELGGSGGNTLTLPSPAALIGATFTIINASAFIWTITTPSGNIYYTNGSNAASITLSSSITLQLISDGASWINISGNGAGLLLGTGYQKFGNGFIMQWTSFVGTSGTWTYPIAFPHSTLNVWATNVDSGASIVTTASWANGSANFYRWNTSGATVSGTVALAALGY